MKKLATVAALVGAIAIVHARDQSSGSAPPAQADYQFEVASLKQNKSGERGAGIRREPGGRVTVTNMPARELIIFAYQLGRYQLVGGPGWLADEFAQERPLGTPAPGEALPPPDPNAPSFFTALQEQLGLKLESTKAPFDVTVIDSAEHPTED